VVARELLRLPCFRPLTGRERDIALHLLCGQCNKEIASMLGLNVQTVKNHTAVIYRKMGVDDAREFYATVIRQMFLAAPTAPTEGGR